MSEHTKERVLGASGSEGVLTTIAQLREGDDVSFMVGDEILTATVTRQRWVQGRLAWVFLETEYWVWMLRDHFVRKNQFQVGGGSLGDNWVDTDVERVSDV